MEKYEEFLLNTVKSIVDQEDAVKVEKKVDDQGTLLTLTVADDDMGKVIGSKGKIADSIRTLLRSVGFKYDVRVSLVINEKDRK